MFAPVKPRLNRAPGSQPGSYWIVIKLTRTALVPGREMEYPSQEHGSLSAFQHPSVNWSPRGLAGWARGEGACSPCPLPPPAVAVRPCCRFQGAQGCIWTAAEHERGDEKGLSPGKHVLIYNGTIFMLVVTTLFNVIGVKNWTSLKECKK